MLSLFIILSISGFYPPDPSKKYTEENDGGRGDYLAELCRRWEEASKIDSSFKEDESKSLPIRHAIIRIGSNFCAIIFKVNLIIS